MEHLQWVWHASRERLPSWHLFSSLFGGLHMPWLSIPVFPDLHQFYDLGTELEIELRDVSMEHLRQALYGSSERLPFRAHGPVPFWNSLMLQLLKLVVSNLPSCLFPTFHIENPSVLSQFCFSSVSDNIWIGLRSDGIPEYVYAYPDGERASFFAWDQNEPNLLAGTENCVRIKKSGLYMARNCSKMMHFICDFTGKVYWNKFHFCIIFF